MSLLRTQRDGDFLAVSVDSAALEAELSNLARSVYPTALRYAINDSARDVVRENRDYMARLFDRPVRFTLNAFHARFMPASSNQISATVERKSLGAQKRGISAASGMRGLSAAQRHYLEVQQSGGARPATGLEGALRKRGILRSTEFLVPTRSAPRNASGNVQPGTVLRVLSQLGAADQSAGSSANATPVSNARRNRRGQARVFFQREGKSPGIYQRKGKAQPVKLYNIVPRAPVYIARFQFEDRAGQVATRVFPDHLARTLDRLMKKRAGPS